MSPSDSDESDRRVPAVFVAKYRATPRDAFCQRAMDNFNVASELPKEMKAVDIGVRPGGGRDDRMLARQDVSAAQAVDLAHVRAAIDGQYELRKNQCERGPVMHPEMEILRCAIVRGGTSKGVFIMKNNRRPSYSVNVRLIMKPVRCLSNQIA
jgi:hypothetical protein